MEKDVIVQEDNYTGTINERYKQIGQEVDWICIAVWVIIKGKKIQRK